MKTHEIIVRGGLGNQLFCLLQGYRFLLEENCNVVFNISNYEINKNINRKFCLDLIYPDIKRQYKIETGKKSFIKYLFINSLSKLQTDVDANNLAGDKTIKLNYLPSKFLHLGYFQHINHRKNDQESLSEMLSKLQPIILKKQKVNHLAIHLRRGDYLLKKHNIHGLIPEDYLYKEAEYFLSKGNFDGITIFTDSPNLINIKKFDRLNVKVKIDQGGDAIEVFCRMCNHNSLIASNSTFSLWAGIIGQIKNFSIPYYWMKGIKSDLLGLNNVRRYLCHLE